MAVDARAQLEKFIIALERHLEACTSRRDPDDRLVASAAQDLAEAFEDYDEALFEATECATPLDIYDGPFEDEDDEDDGPRRRVYSGLDDEEFDEDDLDDEDDEGDDDEDDDDDARPRRR